MFQAGRWLTAAVLTAAFATTALAQSLEEKKAAKLAEPWVKSGGWVTDYDKARKLSEESSKPIFVYFTRSYAG